MLRIHTVTSASNAKNYYAAADYYADGQETIGRWGGQLAARLGLAGPVTKDAFDLLCDNRRPDGSPLTPRTNEERRVGYDFVFSGPKSFSIVEALAGEEERRSLLRAFDQAIVETMREAVEPDMQTRERRAGADIDRTTGNLLSASFDHSTARPPEDGGPPDMHRHRHVFVFNATYDPAERRIKAGQFGNLKRDGEYYTAIFYAKLAGKLEALGYRIDRRGGKAWEIAGVPQSLIDTFSKRTDEVEAEHAERLKNDPGYRPEHKHELGAKTRSKKQKELTPEQLRAAWEGQLTRAERRALARVFRREIAPGPAIGADAAVAYAVHHCFEQESVVPERELKRVALLYGLGSVTPEAVDAELPRQGVIVRQKEGRAIATTRALQREEEFIAGFATGLGPVRPVGVPDGFERGTLDADQWQAVQGLLKSSCRVNLVDAAAGTGKTTMLHAYDRAMRMQGENVTYLASSSDAVRGLQQEGFDAVTVAHFLLDAKKQAAARGGRVVVDEAGMLGHRDAYRLFQVAKDNNLKLNLLGDSRQHGSVPRGALFRVLRQYGGVTPFTLSTIKRQKAVPYREAVQAFAGGDTLAGFDRLDQLGWIREQPGDRTQAIAAEYREAVEAGKSCIVIAPTHAEGGRITQAIRAQLRQAGRLGTEEREFTRLVAANWSEAERGNEASYRASGPLVLQFHQNGKKGIKNGTRLPFDGSEAGRASLPLAEAAKFQVYKQESIALAAGDMIRFTGTVKSLDGRHTLRNGATHTVAGFTQGGNIRLENGWVIGKDAGHFRHGVVETSFSSQGKTRDRAILAVGPESLPAANQEMAYVSSSRARERMTLYCESKEEVREAIRRSSAKLAALDLMPPPEPPRFAERLRRQAERLRRIRFFERLRAERERLKPVRPEYIPAERQVTYGR